MIGKRRFSVMFALVLALTVVSVTAAAHTTINTDDSLLDSNWSFVTPISNDGAEDATDDNYDIDQAWITNAADYSAFYFRVSMVGTGQLPHDYSSFEARLDCDQNGNFHDAVDVVVYYAIKADDSEELSECQGSDYWQCSFKTPTNTSDLNTPAFGEELTSGVQVQYEWRADVDNGAAVWTACLGEIDVQFATLNSSFEDVDTTTPTTYNVVTAVDFVNAPQPRQTQFAVTVVVGLIILSLMISGLRWYQKNA